MPAVPGVVCMWNAAGLPGDRRSVTLNVPCLEKQLELHVRAFWNFWGNKNILTKAPCDTQWQCLCRINANRHCMVHSLIYRTWACQPDSTAARLMTYNDKPPPSEWLFNIPVIEETLQNRSNIGGDVRIWTWKQN